MASLLSSYSLTTILLVGIAIVFAIKEIIELIEFFQKRIKTKYEKDQQPKNDKEEILTKLDNLTIEVKNISSKQLTIETKIEEQQDILDLLIDSDKDQIKSAIVKDYHRFMEKGWIDDFSMDALEKCFTHYRDEGGNTYVCDLMKDLRTLPHHPKKN